METLKKVIDETRTLGYEISEGYAEMHTISDTIIGEEGPETKLDLCRWDDYGFKVWTKKDVTNTNMMSFEYDIDHPLYFPLMHLINFDETILIDDDDTYGMNMKYMLIRRNENNVQIDFVNNLPDQPNYKKFYTFIKNIGYDQRSKLTDQPIDVKTRLWLFYREVENIMRGNVDNQISIEEYYLRNVDNPNYELLRDFYYIQSKERLMKEYPYEKGYVYQMKLREKLDQLNKDLFE